MPTSHLLAACTLLCLVPTPGYAKASNTHSLIGGAILEFQGFLGSAPPWRPEGPDAVSLYNALVYGSLRAGALDVSLSIASGDECLRIGAISPVSGLCIPQARIAVQVYRKMGISAGFAIGSDFAVFGAASTGSARVNNPGPLTLAGLTMPFTTAGMSATVEATNKRWSCTIGLTTWNGVLPASDSGDPAAYAACAVSPFSQTTLSGKAPDTDTTITLAYLGMGGSHALSPLHAGDISFNASYKRLFGTGEIHAGTARANRNRWVCGTLAPGIVLHRGRMNPLLIGIIEGCHELFEPGTSSALLGPTGTNGTTFATGLSFKTTTDLSRYRLTFTITGRYERTPTALEHYNLILNARFVL